MAFNSSTRSWKQKINRIVFNEITKEAIHSAIKKPKKINENLVNAQQAKTCS